VKTQGRRWAFGSAEDRLLFQVAISNRLPTNRASPAGSSFATHLRGVLIRVDDAELNTRWIREFLSKEPLR
jgi:hypothetical protein